MSKIIHYRDKCIGCNICFEQQPSIWRMSKKDGKAVLLNALKKKSIFIININESEIMLSEKVANACPVKIIKILK